MASLPLPFTPSLASVIALIYFFFTLVPSPAHSAISTVSIRPNFTASFWHLVENSGAILASQNNTFRARIVNPIPESTAFYFVIVHVPSDEIVWSANRGQPFSAPSQLQFTQDGLSIYNDSGQSIWSTPKSTYPSSSLKLLESGNLIMLDANNNTLWESFDYPTDVLMEGQKLRVGKSLVSSLSDTNLSEGSYKFVVGVDDVTLQWNGMDYWKLFMYGPAYRDSLLPAEYMMMNVSGIYLLANNSHRIVVKAPLSNSDDVSGNASIFRMAKLDSSGAFNIIWINLRDGSRITEFTGPEDRCKIPIICGNLGLCTRGGSCDCATGFHHDVRVSCMPNDTSLDFPGACNGSSSHGDDIKYFNLTDDLDYFSNGFTNPVAHDVNLSACQSLCSGNCSCLGVFHSQDSGSCYMIRKYFGSFITKSSIDDRMGYVKMVAAQIPTADLGSRKPNFPVLVVVLLTSSGAIVIALVVALVWLKRKMRLKTCKNLSFGKYLSSAEDQMEFDSTPSHFPQFPGLPARFDYKELAAATQDFRTEIGSGGFGTVYKGTLVDGTDVAVKRIDGLGSEAKREFLTELAAIGKIHHVNLVQLKGFCTHHGQRFLVYEYMNQGSLDRNLFRGKPVLEWKERYKIALGTARGLEYLHTSCDHKVIHCDIKPENILLHNSLHVKISDFGLSKLLTRDQSNFFTLVKGTRGYIAPEWLMNTAISEKTDVYSYGMLLLEIISGKKNFFQNNTTVTHSSREDFEHHQQVNFPLCAMEMHMERQYQKLVDPRLNGEVHIEEVEKLVRVALCCVHREPCLRPSMSDVVRMLKGEQALGEPRMESLKFLRFYDPVAVAENNEDGWNRHESSTTSIPDGCLSYISSEQVSGPR